MGGKGWSFIKGKCCQDAGRLSSPASGVIYEHTAGVINHDAATVSHLHCITKHCTTTGNQSRRWMEVQRVSKTETKREMESYFGWSLSIWLCSLDRINRPLWLALFLSVSVLMPLSHSHSSSLSFLLSQHHVISTVWQKDAQSFTARGASSGWAENEICL